MEQNKVLLQKIFPAIVTMKTGKPAKMVYTREESMTNGSPRHEMEIKVKLGADENGIIKAIDMYTLSNAGAYGDHRCPYLSGYRQGSRPDETHIESCRRAALDYFYDMQAYSAAPSSAYKACWMNWNLFKIKILLNFSMLYIVIIRFIMLYLGHHDYS